ncbi:hypothetical protein [uncultured Duncaniella sp.]|uniref:hypothetical protein n=1 Tax=uncultured Duncaniella sp. TaxID=2768039 RepID=UPI0025B72EFF|nr:hypothetical protein [uncultured Duncaniella sp.]
MHSNNENIDSLGIHDSGLNANARSADWRKLRRRMLKIVEIRRCKEGKISPSKHT